MKEEIYGLTLIDAKVKFLKQNYLIILTTKDLSGDRDFGEGSFSQLKFALRVSVILLLLFDTLNH